jgi:two-component system cell cycle response regulator
MNVSSGAVPPRLFFVELIGFAEGEASLLLSTFRLTDRRQYSYARDASRRTDLYLVNADSSDALEQLRIRGPNLFCPAVLIGQSAGLPWPQVQRPIAWTRLFDTLDMVMGIAAEKRNSRPQAPWDGSPRRRHDPPLRASAAPARNESVLVVDDSATVRAFMRSRLSPFRFDVDFAASGETAVEMARDKRYTCIFLDILMPGIDGYETCRRLKSDARTRDTAVVMLSSKSGTLDKIRGNWSGCDAYLGKPVEEDELLATIARYLPSARQVVKGMLGNEQD